MGGSVSIVNQSMCVLTVTMEILGVPYYWENELRPGETLNRSDVGLVWFTLDVFPWHGGNNLLYFDYLTTPAYYTSNDGRGFTLLGDIGIPGFHSSLVGKRPVGIPWKELTPLEAALVNGTAGLSLWDRISMFGAPFGLQSNGWYVHSSENIWEIRGGPHCEIIQDECGFKDHGKVEPRKVQVFDFPTGNERSLEIVLLK